MDLEVEWGLFDHGSGRGRAVPGLGWAKACPLLGSIELALWWRVAKLPSGRPMKYRLATSKKRGFLVHRHGRTLLYFVRHRNRRPSLHSLPPHGAAKSLYDAGGSRNLPCMLDKARVVERPVPSQVSTCSVMSFVETG